MTRYVDDINGRVTNVSDANYLLVDADGEEDGDNFDHFAALNFPRKQGEEGLVNRKRDDEILAIPRQRRKRIHFLRGNDFELWR